MASIHPDTALHVRQTWKAIEAVAPQASALFYDHLFIADPTLVPLFGDNMSEQGDKLMLMLGFAVQELNNPDSFLHAFQALGRRHAAYGVQHAHYPLVGEALLKTLAEVLGDRFTPPVRDAWTAFYDAMAEIMMAAADAVSPRLSARARSAKGAA